MDKYTDSNFQNDNDNRLFKIESDYGIENNANNLENGSEIYQIIAEYELEIKNLKLKLSEIKIELEQTLNDSYVDPLTSCLNQNYFENKFKSGDFNPDHDRNKVALVYIDLNGLKQINDTPVEQGGGHKAGDKLIQETANFLKSQFREDDTVVRLHGDEFVIICRDRNGGIVEDILKNRVNLIREAAINRAKPLSFATGVAVFGDNDVSLDDTEIRAEQEMYGLKTIMKMDR